MIVVKSNTNKNQEVSTEDLLNAMLENFDEQDIFELAKKVTEKYEDTDKELYDWFHDYSNIGRPDFDKKDSVKNEKANNS